MFCLPQQKDIIMCATGGPGKNFKFETGSILYVHKLKKVTGLGVCLFVALAVYSYLSTCVEDEYCIVHKRLVTVHVMSDTEHLSHV